MPVCRYWFLTEVYPQASGRHVITTPLWLSRLCLQYRIGRVPIKAVNPSDLAFQGQGGALLTDCALKLRAGWRQAA